MNSFLATFHDVPALVNPGMQKQVEASLAQASLMHDRFLVSNDNIVMADDFWPPPDSWLATYRPYFVKDGIQYIPVKGVLIHGMGYALGNWATGYVYLTKALERGLADPEVKGIAWIHDSPGGHVAGTFDLGDKIFAARDKKPMCAFVAESSYSASYLLASAAGPITVSRTGGVGSIGIVTSHFDVSKAMENDGYKVTFIHFGKHKVDGNSYEALPKDVKDRMQARIDELGEIFVSTVARNRGMDEQAVRDTEALTFTAKEATSNGLADAIGSLEDAIAIFAADLSNPIPEVRESAFAKAFKEAAIAERVRISAILTSAEAKTRPAAAKSVALEMGMATPEALAFLAKLPPEAASRPDRAFDLANGKNLTANVISFSAYMDRSDQPNVGVMNEPEDGRGPSRADRVFQLSGKKKPIDPLAGL